VTRHTDVAELANRYEGWGIALFGVFASVMGGGRGTLHSGHRDCNDDGFDNVLKR
jgi:hypothetical protein